MKFWSKHFFLDALLYVKFFQNFFIQIVDIKKKLRANVANMLSWELKG